MLNEASFRHVARWAKAVGVQPVRRRGPQSNAPTDIQPCALLLVANKVKAKGATGRARQVSKAEVSNLPGVFLCVVSCVLFCV